MSNQQVALQSNNAAIRQISGGSTRPIAGGEDIRTTAAKNTKSVDNSQQVNDQVQEESTVSERKLLWYTLGISLGVGLLIVLALKLKILKI